MKDCNYIDYEEIDIYLKNMFQYDETIETCLEIDESTPNYNSINDFIQPTEELLQDKIRKTILSKQLDEVEVYKKADVDRKLFSKIRTQPDYHPNKNTVIVDRRQSGWPEHILNRREFNVRNRQGKIRLRFIIDRYSIELFVNDGEEAASFEIFSPEEADAISFEAEGKAVIDAEQYTLNI